MSNNATIAEVIEVLKGAQQTLVSLDGLDTPVRRVIPNSKGDKIMQQVIEELKSRGVIDYSTGFWSKSEIPGFYYATSFSLRQAFFEAHCTPRQPRFAPHQLSLFGQGAA